MEVTLSTPLAFTASSPSCAPAPPHYPCRHASARESRALSPHEAALRRVSPGANAEPAARSLALFLTHANPPGQELTRRDTPRPGRPQPRRTEKRRCHGLVRPGIGLGWMMSPAVQATIPAKTLGDQEPAEGGWPCSCTCRRWSLPATCSVSRVHGFSAQRGLLLCLFLSKLYSF